MPRVCSLLALPITLLFFVGTAMAQTPDQGGDLSQSLGQAKTKGPPQGVWSAELSSPGGPLAFGLDLRKVDGAWAAWLVNGEERIPVPSVEWSGRSLRLDIDHYDARIHAAPRLDGDRMVLEGMWTKRTGLDDWSRMTFRATSPDPQPAHAAGPASPSAASSAPEESVAGRWRVDFASDEQPAVGVFEQVGDELRGTFLTTTGDYRYLSGVQDGEGFTLSCFDGAHAFLFKARLQDDGSLAGDFWSRDVWHDTWTAVRDETIRLPDGFALTQWTGLVELGDLAFPDLTGEPRHLDDPLFAGNARILQVFGSWCPNCHDASDFLSELQTKYGPRGLSIVGLAFEITGDFTRDAEQVLKYAERHDVAYPLLVAGMSDKAEATRRFPLLDEVRSYPTTIFLHGDGRVRAIYQGFSGPATGRAHDELKAAFEAIIEELLAESGA